MLYISFSVLDNACVKRSGTFLGTVAMEWPNVESWCFSLACRQLHCYLHCYWSTWFAVKYCTPDQSQLFSTFVWSIICHCHYYVGLCKLSFMLTLFSPFSPLTKPLVQLQIEESSRRLRSGDLGIPANQEERLGVKNHSVVFKEDQLFNTTVLDNQYLFSCYKDSPLWIAQTSTAYVVIWLCGIN